MNKAVTRFTPSSNWMSAALITLFVASVGLLAESQMRDRVIVNDQAKVCTTKALDTGRLFIRIH